MSYTALGDFGDPSLASQTADSQRVATRTDLRGVGGRDRRMIGLDDLEGVLKDVDEEKRRHSDSEHGQRHTRAVRQKIEPAERQA